MGIVVTAILTPTPVRARARQSANPVDQATLTVNEKILRECHTLYTDPDKGLIKIAETFGLRLLPPRKKIVVLLIGNHSAGKSSFINWYVEEHVQKTGVAIETQGFVLVTSGKKRESLTGNATLHLYPHLKPLQKIHGVIDFLSTEISTSKQKKFSLVTFIDTPGLVDGDMQYPYDVNQTVEWLGEMADLVFVFFDPIGQALCKRTLTLVERLNARHPEKIRFYLSKADDAGNESDRQRVMMQIVQELCKRPGLNRTGFAMPTIYIPDLNKATRCVNQIEEVCADIERVINHTVQNTLNALERDCDSIFQLINKRLMHDVEDRAHNFKTSGRAMTYGALGAIVPFFLVMHLLVSYLSDQVLVSMLGETATDRLTAFLAPVGAVWALVPRDYQWTMLAILLVLSSGLFVLTKWSLGLRDTLSRRQKRSFDSMIEHIEAVVKVKKQLLYHEYLEQSVGDHDL